MLTKQQLNIFAVFAKDLSASYTFKQIKELSKQKSNNIVQIALKEFQQQQLVKTQQTGNVATYQLNLEQNLTLAYLQLIQELELKKRTLPGEILFEIQRKIFKHTPFFTLLVFGSYAKNKVNKNSDLDVALIVESEATKREITPILETIKRRELLKIDYHLFTTKEYLQMLGADDENLGKQIYKNNIVFYGLTAYLQLIIGKRW